MVSYRSFMDIGVNVHDLRAVKYDNLLDLSLLFFCLA